MESVYILAFHWGFLYYFTAKNCMDCMVFTPLAIKDFYKKYLKFEVAYLFKVIFSALKYNITNQLCHELQSGFETQALVL